MKKVTVVSGSPRKRGNTMKMVGIIESNLCAAHPETVFEYIHLIEKDLKYCLGCTRCLREGGAACPHRDDGAAILRAMREADGIIFATPGYSHMVSGLFKNFLDRFMYLDHIPEFVGKPALIISTSGGDGVMGAPRFTERMAITWWGCTVTDVIGIGHAFFAINEKYQMKMRNRLRGAAEKFYREMAEQPVRRPTLLQYLCFILNRTELEISPTAMPYRARVWREMGWMKKEYYYTTRVNPIFRVVGALTAAAMKGGFRMLLGTNGDEKMAAYFRNN